MGTSPVHFDITHFMSINTSIRQDSLIEEFLRAGMWVSDRHSFCRMVGGSSKDATKDDILIGNGVLVSLENNGATRISTTVAIGGVVVCLAGTRF